ncbi:MULTISPECIES: type IV secretion system lytic transglycosylase VirB1 [Rhizobium]|uniref:Type IV secretion system lytic transglycosylase VirB1 n=1 Tax=Rhizobium rhododendri TaxID=2506430 RepID=A0ABY8IR03_9HYPH|nr:MULTISPECIES: type IV secretion system lytic transglycosylase VirB1 [Rhizobium]MBZ5763491.1 type IV secretion system lytic transglycosylase VirB1 [Rhizobium sp. VS19-DR96]MBZ5769433.1 type IV secretion system lytic transglycosylase VirB1 [Rhizobium sp. VS19-DR129.2]MBZ5776990.1 type IV secretion system lytic transglycosylase VirB1 [Rhizobium sp. VS19-DRK62.2]MBZ5788058.1 type IV secretion system lytic transglycosylase VirB1 [Rhizobium sp. VS19-DR121]MBZ5805559.1 type IV secretion system lyt
MLKTTGGFSTVLWALMIQPAAAAPLSLMTFDRYAQECGPSVASSTLAAIAKVESQLDPLAMHDNTTGETLHWNEQARAIRSASDRLQAGHSIDVGLMQINSANFSTLRLSIGEAFEPCPSLSAAARILVKSYRGGTTTKERQQSLRQALSMYNTGDPQDGFANGYVRRVEVAAQQLVPALSDVSKNENGDDRMEETWNVWETYDQQRLPSVPPDLRGSDPPVSEHKNQILLDLKDGGA